MQIDWRSRPVLYRFYNSAGMPVYFGTTRDWETRWRTHRATKSWWPEVHRVKLTLYPNFFTLERAERVAIMAERPRHNKTHHHGDHVDAPRLPWSRGQINALHRWRTAQLGQRGAEVGADLDLNAPEAP